MTLLTDHEGRRIRLTDERWRHILEHPEMTFMREALEEILAAPESVMESLSDPAARLYYRFYQRTIVGGRYLCAVVRVSPDDAFVVTAYLTDRIKKGRMIWPRK